MVREFIGIDEGSGDMNVRAYCKVVNGKIYLDRVESWKPGEPDPIDCRPVRRPTPKELYNSLIRKKLHAANSAPPISLKEMALRCANVAAEEREKEKRMEQCRQALHTLVFLKTYKEKYGKDSFYLREAPVAWERAREVMKLEE